MHKFAVVISSEMLCRVVLATSACGSWKRGDKRVWEELGLASACAVFGDSWQITVLRKAYSGDGQRKMNKYMYIYLLYI